MNAVMERARIVLAQVEPTSNTATALRELIAFAEGLTEDLDHYNRNVGRAATAIEAKGVKRNGSPHASCTGSRC
jgi:hypothetical protein